MKLKNSVKRSLSISRCSKLNDIFNSQSRKRPKLNYYSKKLVTLCFLAVSLLIISGNPAFASTTLDKPTITTTPELTIAYDKPYNYSIVATTEGELETTISVPTLPAWLSASAEGQNQASRFGDIPQGVSLSGVAGDDDGNIYAIISNGTTIYKIASDGNTTLWREGLISGSVYALHIANGYLYIPRYSNATQSITRLPLNNPSAAEETFASIPGGALSLTDKDGWIYAADWNSATISRVNESSKEKELLLDSSDGVPSSGPFGLTFDQDGNLYIATWSNRSILKYDGSAITTVLSGLPNSVSSIRQDRRRNFYLSMSGGGVRKYTNDFSSYEDVSLSPTDNIWSLSFTSSGALVYAKFVTNEVYRLQTGAILTGTPSKSDLGDHPVVIRATNDAGYVDQAFTITVIDTIKPAISVFSPLNNATEVDLKPTLSFTFDEGISLASAGTLSLISGGSTLRTYDLSVSKDRNAFTLSADKKTLSLDITESLPINSLITIEISAGFVKDASGNNYSGITGASGNWNFTTINTQVPTVTTVAVSNFYATSATLGGNVTDDGGASVTERGVVYSTTDMTPTIAEGATKVTFGSGTGSFSQTVGSLTTNTLYYIQAYATNSVGTSYGSGVSFTTTKPTITFNTSSSNGSETLGSADLQVDLSAASGLTVTVDYTVTGTATGADYTLADGTLTMTAGDVNDNITIASIVNDLLDENNETVIVTLSSPTNATLGTNTVHTYTINDNDATPTVAFNASSSNGSETLGSADLQVDLSVASGLPVTVDYTVTGTATGDDYTLADGTLTIAAGDTNDNITIASIVNDLLDENNETVIVTLSSPTNATLGTNPVHTYTINDNDATPTVAFNSSSSNASEALGSADLLVDLSVASGLPVTVDYTVTGTAEGSGTDYTLADGTLTIAAGDANDRITIAGIVDDLLDENNETVVVTLSSPTNATLGTNTVHTYTINDDDETTAPVVTNDSATTDEDQQVLIDVLENDYDLDDNLVEASVSIQTQPEYGRVSVNSANGVVTYEPYADYHGIDTFTYTVKDSALKESAIATVDVTVTPVNDAPIALYFNESTNEDMSLTLDARTQASDIEDGIPQGAIEIVGEPDHGTANVISEGNITYQPDENFFGQDSFVYRIADSEGLFSTDTEISILVGVVNDRPVVRDDEVTTDEDVAIDIDILANDSDVEDGSAGKGFGSDQISLQNTGQIDKGTVTVLPDGKLRFEPKADVYGTQVISYTLTDSDGYESLPANLTISIIPVNDAPVAVDNQAELVEEGVLEINVLGNDYEIDEGDQLDPASVEIVALPEDGELTVTTSGAIRYQALQDYYGDDSFTYLVKDSYGVASNVATVHVTIQPVNDTPVVEDETFVGQYSEQNSFEIDVLENDSDIDGDTLAIIAASASVGEVVIKDGKLTYQAPAGFTGNVELQYLVGDGNGEIVQATVSLVIEGEVEQGIPILTVPDDVVVNATALFTRVDLGVATARNSSGKALPVSLLNSQVFYTPGKNIAYWRTEDAQGNTAEASQKVTVYPMVTIAKDGDTTEGTTHTVQVYLNGQSPVYPVVIPYSVSGSADQYDHDLRDGNVTIEYGTVGEIEFKILQDAENESDEALTITLDPSLNLGSKTEYTLRISEQNIAPKVTTSIVQQTEVRQIIVNNNELVIISAEVTDANIDDGHQYIWSSDDPLIVNTSQVPEQFIFTPAQLSPGIYHLNLTVKDDGSEPLSVSKDIYLEAIEALASLGSGDTDGDLIPDNEEGFSDNDNDGIPDYQDAISECNVIQEQVSESVRYLVEGEPGVCLRKGITVASNETGGTHLLDNEISEQLEVDQEADNIGGVFDFVAYGLPQAGQSYKVVFPQRLPIPVNAIYRKFVEDTGWVDFVIDDDNELSSTQGEPGYCPPPGDESWVIGLNQGHWCVQLTIQDGGPNDDDGIANGSIIDPGGVAVRASDNELPVAQNDTVTMSWNSSITIDVLANDSDIDGNILDIANAVADFGVVDIVNNQLYYTAKDQYYGVATVNYCITDNSGGTGCADVTINVVEPRSVVVENSAGGGIGGATLVLLTLLSITRRYSRKSGLALLLFISFSSQANWYIELDLGQSIARDSAELGADKITNIDDNDFYWTVGLGYSINAQWDVTARYIDQGQGGASIIGNTITPDEYHQTIARVSPVLASGVGVDARYSVWQRDAFKFAVNVGAMYWETDFDSVYQGQTIKHSDDGIDPYLGVELGYDINSQWSVGLGATRYFIEANDVDAFSLKLKYRMNIEKD